MFTDSTAFASLGRHFASWRFADRIIAEYVVFQFLEKFQVESLQS